MRTSETLGELAGALAAAQGIMEIAKKDSTNTFFTKGPNKSKYADINNVWLACRAALSKHNLAIIQSPSSTPERYLRMTTRIIHKTGEWIEDEIDFKSREDTPQAFGSCITYARRYSLCSMLGVIAEDQDDDDGNAASIAPKRLEAKKQEDNKLQDPPHPVTKEKAKPLNSCDPEMDFMGEVDQVSLFYKLCKEFNISDAEFAKHLVVKCKTHATGIKIKDLRTFILSQITDINIGDATP